MTPIVQRLTDTLGLEQGIGIYTHALVAFLALSNLLLLGALVWLVARGTDVLVVTPFGATINALKNTLPDGPASEAAMRWVQDNWTFTPETVKQVQEDLVQTLHPAWRKDFQAQMVTTQKDVKKRELSSQVKPIDAQILSRSRDKKTLLVRVQAYRSLWVGSDKSRQSGFLVQEIRVQLYSAEGSPLQIVFAPGKVTRDDTLGIN